MGDIIVRLVFNRETGKKDIIIDYTGEGDALPHEHEKRHREIVQGLLGKGVFAPDELGQVRVRRGADETASPQPEPTPPPEDGLTNKA